MSEIVVRCIDLSYYLYGKRALYSREFVFCVPLNPCFNYLKYIAHDEFKTYWEAEDTENPYDLYGVPNFETKIKNFIILREGRPIKDFYKFIGILSSGDLLYEIENKSNKE